MVITERFKYPASFSTPVTSELELTITPADIIDTFLTRKQFYLEGLRTTLGFDGKTEFSPNLFQIPFTMIYGPMADRDGALKPYLLRAMDIGLYARVQAALDSFGETNRNLLTHLIESDDRDISHNAKLDALAPQQHQELSAFAKAYNALVRTPLEDCGPVEGTRLAMELTKKPGVDARQAYRSIAIRGLLQVVITANCLYGISTRDECLSNLSEGKIHQSYMDQYLNGFAQGSIWVAGNQKAL